MKALRRCALSLAVLLCVSAVYAQSKPRAAAAKPAAKPAPAAPAVPAPPPPLATVNGTPLTRDHVDQAIDTRWAVPVMRLLIENRLIALEAQKQGVKLTPLDIEKALSAERAKFPSERAFQKHLQALGMTQLAYTEQIARGLTLQRLMAKVDTVTEADARKYYDAHQAEYAGEKQVHLLAIVTTTIEDAYLARERLAGGDRFDVVAKELSVHQSREKGGDFGWVSPGDLPEKTLADAIFAQEVNVVSNPLRAGSSYWIALVKGVQGKSAVAFDQAKAEILAKLRAEKTLTTDDYLRTLARRANIQVNWGPAAYLTATYRSYRDVRVKVDDRYLDLDDAPVRQANGVLMAPAKPLLQAIGARLDWKPAEQSLTATTLAGRVKLVVGSTKALSGEGTTQVIDIKDAPVMKGGQVWVSPRAVLVALGARVVWDAANNTLDITSPAQSVPPPTVPAGRGGLDKQP